MSVYHWSDKIGQIGQRCLYHIECAGWARQEIISQEQSNIDEFRFIGRSHLYKQGGCSFLLKPMHS